jgi:hypothetical protein
MKTIIFTLIALVGSVDYLTVLDAKMKYGK